MVLTELAMCVHSFSLSSLSATEIYGTALWQITILDKLVSIEGKAYQLTLLQIVL
jgi:hypothetical protein